MPTFHPKLVAAQVALLVATAATAALAAWTDDVSWQVPAFVFASQVLAGLVAFLKAGGVTGATVDLQGLSTNQYQKAVTEASSGDLRVTSSAPTTTVPVQPPG